jgi:hypothetical protein
VHHGIIESAPHVTVIVITEESIMSSSANNTSDLRFRVSPKRISDIFVTSQRAHYFIDDSGITGQPNDAMLFTSCLKVVDTYRTRGGRNNMKLVWVRKGERPITLRVEHL